MDNIVIGQKRQWNASGNIYTVLERIASPYKQLWKVKNEDGTELEHEEMIMLTRSSVIAANC